MKSKWNTHNIPDQSGKIVIVTGANSGLGFDMSKALAGKNAHVIMASRNAEKAEDALARIKSDIPNANIEHMALDLADLEPVKRFAKQFTSKFKALDILINNAGVMATPQMRTKDGFEMQFGTNHLGHYALTGHLLPLLKATPKSRVVNVSSLAARKGKMQWDNLMNDINYQSWRVYRQSKLANQLFTYALNRRLQAAGLDSMALAAHPGVSSTNLHHSTKLNAVGFWIADKIVMPLMAQASEKGALPILYAATASDVDAGGYYGPSSGNEYRGYPAPAQIPDQAKTKKDQEKLWEISEELTEVRYNFSTDE